MIVLLVLIIFISLYLFMIYPRKNKNFEYKNLYYAHRGFHNENASENSINAFKKANDLNYGIELDLQLSKDNKLVVFHDKNLVRMCNTDKVLHDLRYDELLHYSLPDGSKIPLFEDVLKSIDKNTPLLVEIKYYHDGVEVVKKAIELLEKYNSNFVIESFDPRVLRYLKKHRKDIVRGQLASGSIEAKGILEKLQMYALKYMLLNFLSRPNFIAYSSEYDNNLSVFLMKKLFKIPMAAYTLKTKKQMDEAFKKGYDMPIFEGFEKE